MNDRINKLVESHSYKPSVVVNKLLSSEKYRSFSYLKEELISEGYYHLLLSAKRYDESRGIKFSTYADWIIKQRLIDFIREYVRKSEGLVSYEQIGYDFPAEEKTKKESEGGDYGGLVKKLAPKKGIKRVVYYRIIINGESLKSVAEDLGKPITTISSIKYRLIKKLRRKYYETKR